MNDVTKNEMLIVLKIFKTPEKEFNANSISKEISITPMGALKILKRMEKEGILVSKAAGKAVFYKTNFGSSYAKDYVRFILRREAEHSSPYVRRWIREVRKLKNAKVAILFGSLLSKENKANDIDVLFVTDHSSFERLKLEIEELNKINEKSIHPIYQSSEDFKENISRQDRVILNSLKGIVAFGEEKLIELVR